MIVRTGRGACYAAFPGLFPAMEADMFSMARLRLAGALGLVLLCLGCTGQARNPCERLNAGRDCGSSMQLWIDGQFGAPPAEAYAAGGGELRRIFGVAAFHAIVGVSFVRRPGGNAEVRVDFARPREPYGSQPEPISTLIPDEIWRRAVAATADLRRIKWRPEGPSDEGGITVCADGVLWAVEVTERPGGPVRRRSSSSCEDERLEQVADELIALARSAFPACRALDARNEVAQFALVDCGLLAGDRMAAAAALDRFNDAAIDRFMDEPQQVLPYLMEDASLDWDGAGARGNAAVAMLLVRKMQEADVSRLVADKALGESSDRVRLTGFVTAYVRRPSGESERRFAPFTQIWMRSAGTDFRLASMEVGAFSAEALSAGAKSR